MKEKSTICNRKVQDLNDRLQELEAERQALEGRRERLSLPALDREFLRKTLERFEEVMDKAENPKKKHLLHQLVKKVLIHDRHKVEVWYGLPNLDSARIAGNLAPHSNQASNMRDTAGLQEELFDLLIVLLEFGRATSKGNLTQP